MDIYNWSITSTGGAITVTGRNDIGEEVKLRNIKTVEPVLLQGVVPGRWPWSAPHPKIETVFCRAIGKDGHIHRLHISK
jgi:hypothetical protein